MYQDRLTNCRVRGLVFVFTFQLAVELAGQIPQGFGNSAFIRSGNGLPAAARNIDVHGILVALSPVVPRQRP